MEKQCHWNRTFYWTFQKSNSRASFAVSKGFGFYRCEELSDFLLCIAEELQVAFMKIQYMY